MKLRIRGSTIRLRLTKPEVEQLRAGHLVEESAEFPGGAKLRYAVAVDGLRLSASYGDSGVVVRLPRAQAEEWSTSDEVGIEFDDGPTHVLVEKDWACMKPRSDEDPAEMFENPKLK